jgi:hypothetical protein
MSPSRRASGNRNWEDAGMSFLRDTRITGYALLIERLRRNTTIHGRVATPFCRW